MPRDRLVKERVLQLPVDTETTPAAFVERINGAGSFKDVGKGPRSGHAPF
jgi:hypothetical protein